MYEGNKWMKVIIKKGIFEGKHNLDKHNLISIVINLLIIDLRDL